MRHDGVAPTGSEPNAIPHISTNEESEMKQERINRINELARKAKAEGLTPEETAERDELRKEYIAAVRENLRAHLDNTYIVDEKGNKRPLPRKDQKGRIES